MVRLIAPGVHACSRASRTQIDEPDGSIAGDAEVEQLHATPGQHHIRGFRCRVKPTASFSLDASPHADGARCALR